jgi:PD-(D/E)XK nuclease superfamily protein
LRPRHLSPSALESWDWCPVHRYARSYRDNVRMSPNAPVWFGTAVHAGLEAAYRGKDWELEFVKAWRVLHKELEVHFAAAAEEDGAPATVGRATLATRGLYLIESALALGLVGEPEWSFTHKLEGLDVPVKGRVDLMDRESHRIYDWKTTQRGWSANMVSKKIWQPAIYSAVYEDAYKIRPTFAYVILPVMGAGPAYVLEAPRTPESQAAAIVRAQEILTLIRADDYGECTCPAAYRPKRVSVEVL